MIKISTQKVERLIDQLSIRQRIKLLQKLECQTLKERWDDILKDIDQRLKKFSISPQDVTKEIQAYRKEKHAGRH